MSSNDSKLPRISATSAARLFLVAAGLAEDPKRRATKAALMRLIDRLGFVQLDSIATIARAHELVLFSRLHGYRHEQIHTLVERRALFEHWTHDASAIPTPFFPFWKARFRRDATRLRRYPWWQKLLGGDADRVIAEVRAKVQKEGPLRSSDFEHEGTRGAWWGWTPQKAALDYLWRTGELAIRKREHFHKVYDLAERLYPDETRAPEPSDGERVTWATESAMERLGVFTARDVAKFWADITPAEAAEPIQRALREGRIIEVLVERADEGPPEKMLAPAEWQKHAEKAAEMPSGMRLLAPFDPLVRDRERCLKRFGFDYRFEAFTPAPKRKYGYYVLPILEGERLVGRVDPKLQRDRGEIEVRGVFWEPGVRVTKARKKALNDALAELARFLGVERVVGVTR